MSENQALAVLADATEPQNIGKISRQGFVAIEQALTVLNKFIAANQPKPKQKVEE